MRYDIFFYRPLRLEPRNGTLWAGHWCSIHSEDLRIREAVLGEGVEGVFAPSQFAITGRRCSKRAR